MFGIRDAILGDYASHALRPQPVAHLGAFEVDGQTLEASAGKYDDGDACVFPLRGIHRHRGSGHFGDPAHRLACDEVALLVESERFTIWSYWRIGSGAWPYQNLFVSVRR